ncbi:MAG TPA: GNAT family protein [Thermomicrobiales bacterium]|jgi:RimJ/RimL family protein N-acetyltransferase
MTIPQPGVALDAATLERSRTLPRKMDPVTLTGDVVELVPLDLARDAAPLHAVSNGQPASLGGRTVGPYDAEEQIWRFMLAGPFADEAAMAEYLRGQVAVANGLCLCVRDRATGTPIGVVNYMNNFPEHLKVELGGIWYSPLAQRTNANLEATSLLLRHAFGLGYRRVEWKCDDQNLRSRRAAERMGFRFEGIQEAHFIIKGRNRDTAWFRILDREWPDVQARLERLLAAR